MRIRAGLGPPGSLLQVQPDPPFLQKVISQSQVLYGCIAPLHAGQLILTKVLV